MNSVSYGGERAPVVTEDVFEAELVGPETGTEYIRM